MKKIIVLILVVIVIFCISITNASEKIFYDVSSSHWAYDSIDSISKLGIIQGYPDGTFKPDGNMTRAEFSKVLFGAMNLKKSYDNKINYEDLPVTHWAYEYIKTTSTYLDGYSGDGKLIFMPDEYIKRVDVVKAIIKAMKYDGKKYNSETLKKISDVGELSKEEQDCIAIAYECDIMKGYIDGTFKPYANMTRAEISKMIDNVNIIINSLNKIDNTKSTNSGDVSGDTSGDVSGEISGDASVNESDEISKNFFDGASRGSNAQKIVDENGRIIPSKLIENSNKSNVQAISENVYLNVVLNGEVLKENKTYSINNDQSVIATIENSSSSSNFIYYTYSYGNNTKVCKATSSCETIKVPEGMTAGGFKLTIWGASVSNGKSFMTDTLIYNFYCTGINTPTEEEKKVAEEENYIKETGLTLDDRDLTFIVTFGGETLKDLETYNARIDQIITVRGKPVNNVKEIRYRWDDGNFITIGGNVGTIQIPSDFNSKTTHKLTVAVVGKNGTISKFSKINFNML